MSDPAVEAARVAFLEQWPEQGDFEFRHSIEGQFGREAAREALKPLRKLHRPSELMCLAPNCGAEDCDHEDECPADYPVTVCAECWRIAELVSSYYGEEGIDDSLRWPCATARLVYSSEE